VRKEVWPNDLEDHLKSTKHVLLVEFKEHREDLQSY
jgi:hypothetical protein